MTGFLVACSIAAMLFTKDPQLSVSQPSGNAVDQNIHILVEHLQPFQEIKIQAETKDRKGEVWSSQAMFQADLEGIVDVASSCPIGNSSYEGIDSMGLVWSMLPSSGDTSSSFKCKDDEISIVFSLYINDVLYEQQTVVSHLKAPEVYRS